MYILITGGGMVGGALAKSLICNKHDVVVVDPDTEVCNRLYADAGVVTVCGSATKMDVLREAGLDKADVMVAATPSDSDNLASAILAKSAKVRQIVVRMRDPDYENAYQVIGVNLIVRVTDLMVNQMMNQIENPMARPVATLANGRANVFMLTIPEKAHIVGKTVREITELPKFPRDCLFTAVCQPIDDAFSIPRGDTVISAGDQVFLVSTADQVNRVVEYMTHV